MGNAQIDSNTELPEGFAVFLVDGTAQQRHAWLKANAPVDKTWYMCESETIIQEEGLRKRQITRLYNELLQEWTHHAHDKNVSVIIYANPSIEDRHISAYRRAARKAGRKIVFRSIFEEDKVSASREPHSGGTACNSTLALLLAAACMGTL